MTNGEVDKEAKQGILKDLETRLEAYVVEWRRELGLRGISEVDIDRAERLAATTERQKDRVKPPAPTR